MKKIYTSLLIFFISLANFSQQALITGYVDSPCSGAEGRVLEIYVDGTIDFTGWNVQRQANGGGYSSSIDLTILGSITDDFVYITNKQTVFEAEFGTQTNVIENSVISSNGDDAFQIIDDNAIVIDRFGVENIDGSGEVWEHEDTYYLRNNGSTANAGNFDATNWMFGALNALDAKGLCNSDSALSGYVALGNYIPAILSEVNFSDAYQNIDENGTSITIDVEISALPQNVATIDVTVLTNESTAISGQDYSYTTQTLTFTNTGALTESITINIADNTNINNDKLIAVELSNPVGIAIGEDNIHAVYILDDEMHAPTGSNTLGLSYLTSYNIEGNNPGSEILAHDPVSKKLFVMNSGNASVEILDFTDPQNITSITSVDLSTYGVSGTSVAYHNGILAATAIPADKTQNGTIVFMDANGTVQSTVTAGTLPDMIIFSPDGTKLLVANEGEPNSDYSIDPEGTISIIDISAGVTNLTPSDVTTLNFNNFDTQEVALKTSGVRIFGPNASVSQDLEPEYITVSDDSAKAWVTLQENNAVAVVDLTTMAITDILPLGYKDYNLAENAFDSSNEQDFIFMANWPVKGVYMPDAIASYTVNGTTYFVTANEGDAREYSTYEEVTSLEDLNIDTNLFPNLDFLLLDENLGKIDITIGSGDIDNDGTYEEIHIFGGRSFSIYDASTGVQVYDSGSDFERIIEEHPTYSAIFNATDDENKLKNRSDNKGPEPEAVLVQEIDGKFYAFVSLERVGGLMVYDISSPTTPIFEGYFNNRSVTPGEDDIANLGDLAPESIVYVRPQDNALNKGLIVIANEVSATISVYEMGNVIATDKVALNNTSFSFYPNPISNGIVFFNQPTSFEVFDIQGRKLMKGENQTHFSTSTLPVGTYIVRNHQGATQKLIVK